MVNAKIWQKLPYSEDKWQIMHGKTQPSPHKNNWQDPNYNELKWVLPNQTNSSNSYSKLSSVQAGNQVPSKREVALSPWQDQIDDNYNNWDNRASTISSTKHQDARAYRDTPVPNSLLKDRHKFTFAFVKEPNRILFLAISTSKSIW